MSTPQNVVNWRRHVPQGTWWRWGGTAPPVQKKFLKNIYKRRSLRLSQNSW